MDTKCKMQDQERKVEAAIKASSIASQLADGWCAAGRGEPYDRTAPESWREGHRLWHWAHPVPGANRWALH